MLRSTQSAALAAALLLAPFAVGQRIAVNSPDGQPLSQRVAAYRIDATLHRGAKTLDATEVVEYRNPGDQPLSTFPFHLYLNAFQPDSTYSRESHQWGEVREISYSDAKTGAISVSSISAEGYGDITQTIHFRAPDDGNMADRTVMEVTLPTPLQPGEAVRFHIAFHDKFPSSAQAEGREGDVLVAGHWFPQIGVFSHGAWICRQYHAGAEFFADFAAYSVNLTLPRSSIVGASGIQTGEQPHSNGTKTVSFQGEDIHDFAWVASSHFVTADDSFKNSLGTVRLHVLLLESHAAQRRRYLSILKRSMQKFDEWYGPYPYKEITVVDADAGGAAYPTLIVAGTEWWVPGWSYRNPEAAIVHQLGCQYWHGMVAANPGEEPQLDEGLEGYSEGRVMDALFGRRTSLLNAATVHAGDAEMQRVSYLGIPGFEPMARQAKKLATGRSDFVSYGRMALSLFTLESLIGEETLRQAMRTYFTRYRFAHPTGADFLHTVEDVSNRNDLEPFFTQAIYGAELLDYSLDSLTSDPKEWWKGKDAGGDYHTGVLVHRVGDFVFPVEVEVTFADGSKEHAHWDGAGRWMRFDWNKPAQALYAQIDPNQGVALDGDRFNDSYVLKSHPGARLKLTNYWVFAQQLFAQWMSFLV